MAKGPTTDWSTWTSAQIYDVLSKVTPLAGDGRSVHSAIEEWSNLTKTLGAQNPANGLLGDLAILNKNLADWNGETATKFKDILGKMLKVSEAVKTASGTANIALANLCSASTMLAEVMGPMPLETEKRADNFVIGQDWVEYMKSSPIPGLKRYSGLFTDFPGRVFFDAANNATKGKIFIPKVWPIHYYQHVLDGGGLGFQYNKADFKEISYENFLKAVSDDTNADHSLAMVVWNNTDGVAGTDKVPEIVATHVGTYLEKRQKEHLQGLATGMTTSYDTIAGTVPKVPDPHKLLGTDTNPSGSEFPGSGGLGMDSGSFSGLTDPNLAGTDLNTSDGVNGLTVPDASGTIGGNDFTGAGIHGGSLPSDLAGITDPGGHGMGGLFTPGAGSGLGLPGGKAFGGFGTPGSGGLGSGSGGFLGPGGIGAAGGIGGALGGPGGAMGRAAAAAEEAGMTAAEAAAAQAGRGGMMFPPPAGAMGGARGGQNQEATGASYLVETDDTIWKDPTERPTSMIGAEEE
jgi:hypothetical protein